MFILFFFFFQAEDGIRDGHVTGVQTCALPISGAAESLRRLTGRYEGGVSFFCRHGDGRLDFGQTASTSSGQYRRGRGLLVRELANDQEIMVAEGQVPPDELAAYALEEFRNGLLTIFWLSQHALDGV